MNDLSMESLRNWKGRASGQSGRPTGVPSTESRLRELLRVPEWGHYFTMLCEDGHYRLKAQAWHFHEGVGGKLEDVEIWLLALASEYLPESPAGGEGHWEARKMLLGRAHRMIPRAKGDDVGQLALPLGDGAVAEAYDEVKRLYGEGSFEEYRAALRAWVRAAREAAEREAS
jgi:hypothetical protein